MAEPVSRFIQRRHLRSADFDRSNHLHPSTVLSLFQDAAGAHVESLGAGQDALSARGMLWVVLRTYYEQLAQPRPYDEVQIETWPCRSGLLDFPRDYRIISADRTLLVQGTSVWTVIRSDSHRLVPAQEVVLPCAVGAPQFPTRLRKLPDFDADDACAICSAFTDIDSNGHVNNTRYADYVMNALRSDSAVQSFQIDYHREVLPDTELTLLTARTDTEARCKGCDSAGALMFSSRITFAVNEEVL